MKKQIMTAFAFSTMMTLAMSFASFAAARSCSLNCPRTRPIDRAKAAKPPSWAIAPRR